MEELTIKELVQNLVGETKEKNPIMKVHSDRVTNTSILFARKIDLPQSDIKQIYLAAILHDIGMVYIPQEISHKEGKLN